MKSNFYFCLFFSALSYNLCMNKKIKKNNINAMAGVIVKNISK